MKPQNKIISTAICLIFLLGMSSTQADPLGTAFTYQGRLLDSNLAADGQYDLQFKLFADPNGTESQVGSTVTIENIEIVDGYFIAELDFGGVFDGANRWLEIGVRPGDQNDPDVYTPLAPRQRIMPTPYALHAQSVSAPLALTAEGTPGTAVLSVGAIGDGVAIGASSPNGDFAVLGKDNTAVWGNSPGGFAGYFTGKGYFSGNVGIGTDDPIFKFQVEQGESKFGGRTVVANSSNWMLAEIREIGTNSGAISLYSDGTGKVQLAANNDSYFNGGNVGIGTTSPAQNLEVEGGVFIDHSGNAHGLDAGVALTVDGKIGKDILQVRDIGANTKLVVNSDGNVGIGTTSPGAKLEVAGQVKMTGGSPASGKVLTSDAAGLASWQNPAGGSGDITAVTAGAGLSGGGTSGDVTLAVGVPLSLTGSVASTGAVIAATNTDTGYGVSGKHNSTGNYGILGTSGYGVYASNSGGNYGYIGSSIYGVYGKHDNSGNYGFLGGSSYGIYGNSLVGVAGVYGEISNSGGYGVYGKNNYTGNYGYLGSYFHGVYGYGSDGNTGVSGYSRGGYGGIGVRGDGDLYDFYAGGPGENYASSSSIRWKRDIEAIDNPLEKIMLLRGVYFNWDAEHGGHHDIGMIAEEVGKVLPEIVVYEENGIDADGMDYSMTTPLLVEAVKALKTQVDDLTKENQDLRSRLDALEELMKGAGR